MRYGGALEDSARECNKAYSLDSGDYGLRSCHNTFLQLGDYRRAAEFAALDPQWAGTPSTQRILATLHSGDRQVAVRAFAELSPNERLLRPCVRNRCLSYEFSRHCGFNHKVGG